MLSHPNRRNARKKKPGRGCKMCKPHKGKWEHRFKNKDRARREIDEVEADARAKADYFSQGGSDF